MKTLHLTFLENKMNKTFTHEEISESLSLYISKRVTKVGLTNSISEWIEQNPIEPVVVGLTDEQMVDLIRGLSRTDKQFDLRLDFAREWLKAQTFTNNKATGE